MRIQSTRRSVLTVTSVVHTSSNRQFCRSTYFRLPRCTNNHGTKGAGYISLQGSLWLQKPLQIRSSSLNSPYSADESQVEQRLTMQQVSFVRIFPSRLLPREKALLIGFHPPSSHLLADDHRCKLGNCNMPRPLNILQRVERQPVRGSRINIRQTAIARKTKLEPLSSKILNPHHDFFNITASYNPQLFVLCAKRDYMWLPVDYTTN